MINNFKEATLEMLSQFMGDTYAGLTGSQISRYLKEANIEDLDPNITKWKRLYNAFKYSQNKYNCANNIVKFILAYLDPSRYLDRAKEHERCRQEINKILAFEGIMINESNHVSTIKRAEKISDIQIRVDGLKNKLAQQNAHREIFHYCNEELLANNYFHAVFEANKGLFHRIRDLSGCTIDGARLIESVFSSNPILIINNYITQSEKDEHLGFCNILKGLCGMFRNPVAHEPKIEWEISEQDALEILGMISYCHRRLDKAQKIRMPENK